MAISLVQLYRILCLLFLLVGCVNPIEQNLRQDVNVLVVEGSITNVEEPQVIRINRSKSDSLTGRFGTLPITGATVEVIVDSAQSIRFTETEKGRYQAPSGFKGQINHAYQLRLTLSDGSRYQSTQEIMSSVPPIRRVYEQFNPNSLPEGQRINGLYAAANDFFIDWQDPANEHNYYRWDYILWERTQWCHTCLSGWYAIYDLEDKNLYEDCIPNGTGYFANDYLCRTNCWQILRNFSLNVFDDVYSNGGLIQRRRVAQIPYYQDAGCLVEIRQTALTKQAYQYFNLAKEQTENTGGIADTPPTALAGNIKNLTKPQQPVVGYFTATAVATVRYWLDRKENTGTPPGLFFALNGRKPSQENEPDPETGATKPIPLIFSKRYARPPTAVCLDGDDSTPTKPEGWKD